MERRRAVGPGVVLPILVALALALAACGDARRAASADSTAECDRCHARATLTGAHAAHLAASLDCDACHVKPPPRDRSHVDGAATIAWGPLATASGRLTPHYERSSGACTSVYCHGAFTGGNASNAPRWTHAGDASCGTCHDIPPGGAHPPWEMDLNSCSGCHPETVTAAGVLIRGRGTAHVNGRVSLDAGHDDRWTVRDSPWFHAFAANGHLASCLPCHGTDLGGGSSGVGCGTCHGTSWATNCVMCHGGTANATGAPPDATWGRAGEAIRVGAHTAHVTASTVSPGFGCEVCHVKPASALTPGHLDAPTATVTFGGRAVNGVTPAPGWDRGSGTCSNVYCHGATMGGAAPSWTSTGTAGCGTCHALPPGGDHPAVTGGLAACAGCHLNTIAESGVLIAPGAGGMHLNGLVDAQGHDDAWTDETSAGFHAFAANRNLLACTACHGADLSGGATGVGCGQCHDRNLPAGVASWRVNCVMCHGGTLNPTGAPPKATWGRTSDSVRIGAHTAHVSAGDLAPGFACDVCHVKPASALTPGHLDSETATVTFSGLAVNGVSPAPQWSRATATCSNTYCHGATMGGAAPTWTSVGTATCGSCHGIPPASGHPAVSGGVAACSGCHPATVDGEGNVIASGGAHLDGDVDAQGHPDAWMLTTSATFHAYAANRDLAGCTICHGPDLDGGSIQVACGSCHDRNLPAGVASWKVNCVMCHGGTQNATGAPPKATWGRAADLIRVGAHTMHVTATDLSPGFGCDVCHLKPATALAAGHVDAETAMVTFAGLAVNGVSPAPQWSRSSATCSNTYCHGATMGGTAPAWTSAGTAACGTCHGVPPAGDHPTVTGGLTACAGCHSATVDASGNVIPPASGGAHLDGIVEAQGHGDPWMVTTSASFHAFSANRSLASCTSCHGTDLAGGSSGVACGTCHGTSWALNCTMCHGGAQNATGAPPKATWGRAADSVRVGAHTMHVTATDVSPGFACDVCHVKPTSALTPGHLDAETATVTFAGIAVNGVTPPPAWDRANATCSNTYCHGATMGGAAPGWTSAGTAACGTCHGLPPAGIHPTVTGGLPACVGCHPATMDAQGSVIRPSAGGAHLDGTVQAQGHGDPWMVTTSASFHAFSANRNLASCTSCHGSDLSGGSAQVACGTCHNTNLPPGVTSWALNCTMCHGGTDNQTGAPPQATWGNAADTTRVGAHTRHVTATVLSPGFACGVCHVTPASALSPGHLDAETATVTFAGLAVNGVAPPPAWSRVTATCGNVYCHGATMGGTTPAWTTVGTAGCGTCHGVPPGGDHPTVTGGLNACAGCHSATMDAAGNVIAPASGGAHLDGDVDAQGHGDPWMVTTSAQFHAFSANRDLLSCTSCHGSDLSGGSAQVACGTCHGASWATNCVMCHGGAQNATGAPPEATWGNAADGIRVGAHTRHLTATALSPGFACGVCHVTPASALSPGHLDAETATVTFAGLAVNGVAPPPAWDRASATCGNVYCHGATMGRTAPAWTTVGTAGCGTCHGVPPGGNHPTVTGGLTACAACHSATMDAAGNVIAPASGGAHLDGDVDAQGHGDPWMVTTSAQFHAFAANRDLLSCTSCHGSDLSGGSAQVACATCHGASWATSCTMCHGGIDNTTGAPPKATWGRAADFVRVGAHTSHVTASDISPGFACDVCHVRPTSALTPGHLDAETASVTFAFLAVNGVATPPAWDRASATCSNTYCHGASLAGAGVPAPTWTRLDGTQGACGACHGVPPPPPHVEVSGGMVACNPCHSDTIDVDGAVISPLAGGKHLDGVLQATGHDPDWIDPDSAGFHGPAARLGLGPCMSCHGADLSGGSARGCDRCHGSPGQLLCTSCHAGVPGDSATRSSHLAGPSTPSSDCRTCHPEATGHFRLPAPGSSFPDAVCLGCHDGEGATLSERTPPLLVGWTEPGGDFHGSRAGAGYGGTLLAPWVRGQAPLPCTGCHDAHASPNAFLLARTVNGATIPQGSIDRAGVGGEALCESCHAGARHATCAGCHVTDPEPAGAACFSCHGHEGVRIFVQPSGTPENYHGESGNCDHCHGSWMTTTDSLPPVITYGERVLVTDVTTSGARISWDTDEPATSYVEYGTGELGLVAGSQLLTTAHEVVLAGLAPSTTYQLRVRSSDASRNVTRSSVLSFATTCATCLAPPTLTPIAPVWTYDDSFSKALAWSAVSAPDGDPVQYRVVLAVDDASFAALAIDSGWMTAQTYTVTLPTGHTYYWRVKARDAVHLTESGWSATSSFWSAYNEASGE